MLRKLGHLVLFVFFISIIGFGFIKVASEMTPYVKEKSPVKVYYTAKPFDVTVDVGDYVIYINSRVLTNIKNFIGEL